MSIVQEQVILLKRLFDTSLIMSVPWDEMPRVCGVLKSPLNPCLTTHFVCLIKVANSNKVQILTAMHRAVTVWEAWPGDET